MPHGPAAILHFHLLSALMGWRFVLAVARDARQELALPLCFKANVEMVL